ncbi:MAG: histidinol-phosphate transaminase [Fimbriimonadaceae bacterium]|nr:histidinol-phosphate transaminase [Fimbriimonadaceae bacterium]QYK55811.1 MAG: histidinol-phosphate transaminase [Fimbriimonadaceae bacterium]
MGYPLRTHISRLHPYSPGKPIEEVQRELGLTDVVKLASNENPYGPSPKVGEALRAAVGSLHLYPDAGARRVREALASHLDVAFDQIALGNGSDNLIGLLGAVFLGGPGESVVMGTPSFVRYDACAGAADSRLVQVPLDSNQRHDLPAMRKAIDETTRLVFIANPNNPTGTAVLDSDLRAFLSDVPATALVVLDEAYFEYARAEASYSNGVRLLQEGFRVAVLRTFSKAYGLAGLRLGYMVADHQVVDAIDRAREPFNVNSLAQVAALAALQDQAHVERCVALNRVGLERMVQEVRAMGLACVPSLANFLVVELDREAGPVFQGLLERGVIVRSGNVLGMPRTIRVSVGTESEVEKFLTAFTEVMKLGVPV